MPAAIPGLNLSLPEPFQLFASQTQTGPIAVSSPVQTNPGESGVVIVVRLTAVSSGSNLGLEVQIQMRDPLLSSAFFTLNNNTSPVKIVNYHAFYFAPGSFGPVPNAGSRVVLAESLALPKYWRLRLQMFDAIDYTFEASAQYLR